VNVLDELENLLLLCLCEKLAAAGRPACVCQHYGGEEPPVGDRCSQENGANGQAWVRRDGTRLAVDEEEITCAGIPCGAGSAWNTAIELGVYRCISAIPTEGGSAPSPEQYAADRELLAADRATLAELLCCWPFAGEAPEGFTTDMSGISILGAEIVPTGPSGSCAGSILTLTVVSALTVADPVPSLFASVDAAPEDPMGLTAVVTWRNEPTAEVFISGPAGGG
jgi:hypothetical protein